MFLTSTFNITAAADDQAVYKAQTGVYPPTGTVNRLDGTDYAHAGRDLYTTDYLIINALFRFDTSALPDSAAIIECTFRAYVISNQSDDSRSLSADWYAWDGTSDSDYAESALTGALSGVTFASLNAGQVNDITLSNADANINRSGTTGIRFHCSGSTPTGVNELRFATLEHATATEAQLIVTYYGPGDGPGNAYIQIGDDGDRLGKKKRTQTF